MSNNFSFCVILAIFVFATQTLIQADDEKYTTKWDNINVDEILGSDRLLKNYFKCLNEEGSCTAEAADLKKNLPEALTTDCAKCTEKQKENIEKVINFLYEKKTDMWTALQDKYDPEKIYFNKHFA